MPHHTIAVRDRAWLDLDSLRVLGPFAGIGPAGLRRALIDLHAADPGHPAVCRLDRRHHRWIERSAAEFAGSAEDLVVAVPDRGADPAAAVTGYLLGTPLGDRPLLLAYRDGFVGAKLSHALGDGRVTNTLLPRLIAAAATAGRPAPPAPVLPGSGPAPIRWPLGRALGTHFGRHPGRLLDVFPVARPPAAAPGDRSWSPDPDYVSVRAGKALTELRRWRDAHLPRVSVAAIQFAAMAVALAEAGLPVAGPGAVVLVDARRYLPPGRVVDGNFAWGLYLRPGDLTDPQAVHRALATELRAGSALVMLALRTARLYLSRGRAGAVTAPSTHVAAEPRPALTLTHLGRLDSYHDLPWEGVPGQWRNISVPTTSGPEAVTASFSDLAGVAHLNVSFHRSTFDPERIRRAAELACAHPIELIATEKVMARVL